jgi:hypothetical protein
MRQQWPHPGGVLDIPQQHMVLRWMAEILQRQPQPRQQRAQPVPQRRAGRGQMQRPAGQPGIDPHQPRWLAGHVPPHGQRPVRARHRQAGVRLGQMQQCLALEIGHRRVLARVHHLQHVFGAVHGPQVEVAVALPGQRLRHHLQAEMLARQRHGIRGGGGRGRRIQHLSQKVQ